MTSTRVIAVLGLAVLLAAAAPAGAKTKPDLVVKSVKAPASASAGSSFEAIDVVKNAGRKKAGRSAVRFTLSTRSTAGSGGIALTGGRTVAKLKPRKKSRGTSDLTVPATAEPGAYFLLACADARRKVKERSERNNCRAAARKIAVDAAAAPAKLSLTPAARAFAAVVAGQRSAPVTFTAVNTGGTATGTIGAQVSGAGFSAGANGCAGRTLAPGASCTVAAIFSPPAVRSYRGSVTVTAPGSTVSAALTGTGTGAVPAPAKLAITGASFAPTEIGKASAPATFTVTNSGGVPTGTIESALDSGLFHSVSAADGCTGASLAAGASCTFAMVFEPAARGAAADSVSLTATPGGTVTAPVSGTGLAPADLSISPTPGFDFGDAVLGSATPPSHAFVVTNDGDVPASGLGAALAGGNTADFAITGGTCLGGDPLAGGASCTVEAEFDPQTAGSRQTGLEVSGTPGGSASTTLTGRGLTAAVIGFDTLVVNFGNVPFNSNSTRTLTLRNTGGSGTSAISLALSGDNADRFQILAAGDTCSGQTLAGGATCTFTIRFAPLNVGAKTAFVTASATQGGAGAARLDGAGTG